MGGSIEQFLERAKSQPRSTPDSSVTSYERWRVDADTQARLGLSVGVGARRDPDKAARILRVQLKTGMPTDLVERNLDAIEAEASRSDFNAQQFYKSSPTVAKWLAEDPNRAAMVGEDLTRLNYVERQLRFIADSFREGLATSRLADIGEAAMRGTATPVQRKRQRELEAQLGHAQADYGITGFFEGVPGAMANQLPIFANTFWGKVKYGAIGGATGAAAGAGVALVGGQLGPQVATPEEVVTVPGAALAAGRKGAALGWKYGGAIEAARLEASLAYLDFEKLRDEQGLPLERQAALGAALIVGAINGGLEAAGLESILKTAPGLRVLGRGELRKALMQQSTRQAFVRYAKAAGQAMVTEGVTEFLQSMVTSSAGELAAMAQDGSLEQLSTGAILDRIFSDQHLSQAVTEGRAGAQAGGGMAAAAGSVSLGIDFRRAQRAQQNAQFFTALGDGVRESAVMERLPEAMQELVKQMTQDGPIETLYTPLDTWNEYWQSKDIDPAQAAEEVLGDRRAYLEAQQTGTDLAIPTERYAVTLAPSAHNTYFAQELRTHPNEMNAREAVALREAMEKEQQAGAQDAAGDTEEAATPVADKILEQLEAAGFDPEAARAQASLYQRVFSTAGQNLGIDPMVLFERYNLAITRPEVQTAVDATSEISLEQAFWSDLIRKREAKTPDQELSDLPARPTPEAVEARLAELKQRFASGERVEATGADVVLFEEMTGDIGGFLAQLGVADPDEIANLDLSFNGNVSYFRPEQAAQHYPEILADYQRANEKLIDLGRRLRRATEFMAKQDEDGVLSALNPDTGGGYTYGHWEKALETLREMARRYVASTTKVFSDAARQEAAQEFYTRIGGRPTPHPFDRRGKYDRAYDQSYIPNPLKPDNTPWGMHSRLEKLVNSFGATMTIEQVKALQTKVKAEEWKWYDMDAFIRAAAGLNETTTSKHELLQWFRAHRLRMVEFQPDHSSNTGGHVFEQVRDNIFDDLVSDQAELLAGEWRTGMRPDLENEFGVFDKILEEVKDSSTDEAGKYGISDYELDELEDWQFESHIVGTIERMISRRLAGTVHLGVNAEMWRTTRSELEDQADTQAREVQHDAELDDPAANSPYRQYTLPGGESNEAMYREIAFALPGVEYKTHAFAERGIVMWARVTDRVTDDGRKLLFIEELQSDLHQEGRKKGYKDDNDEALEAALQKVLTERPRLAELTRKFLGDGLTAEEEAEYEKLQDERLADQEAYDILYAQRRSGVVDAPFRKTWHEFVFKRLLVEAVRLGYHGLGWTTGDQQNERWGLEKVFDSVSYDPDSKLLIAERRDAGSDIHHRV
jgi:hypothetical protein